MSRMDQQVLGYDREDSQEVIWEIPSHHHVEACEAHGHDGTVKFIYNRLEDGSLNPALDHSGEVPPSVQHEIETRFKECQAEYLQHIAHARHTIAQGLDELTKRAIAGDGQTSEDFERYEELTEALKANVAAFQQIKGGLLFQPWPYAQLILLEMSYSVFNPGGTFELCRPDIFVTYHQPMLTLELFGLDGSWEPHTTIRWDRVIRRAVFEIKDGIRLDHDIKQLRYFKQFLPQGTEINLILTERAWPERKYFQKLATRVMLFDPEIGLLESFGR